MSVEIHNLLEKETMTDTDKFILSLVKEDTFEKCERIEWNEFILKVENHKIGGFLYNKLIKREKSIKIPEEVRNVLKKMYCDNATKFIVYKNEFDDIISQFRMSNVHVVSVKGISLIQRIYDDPGERTLNDFDFLILKDEREKIAAVLNRCNYNEGELDENNNIQKINRNRCIYTRLFTDGMNPFYKVTKNDIFMCDLRYRIHGDSELSRKMIGRSIYDEQIKLHRLSAIDELIYLCEHLHREAMSIASIYNQKDLILIKFIDIYNFYQKYYREIQIDELVDQARIYSLDKSVFFTFYYLQLIYNDREFEKITSNFDYIKIDDIDVIGIDDLGKNRYFKPEKNFWVRLFSNNNIGEIKEMPHWKEI